MCIFTGYYVLERISPGRMQTASLIFGVVVRFVWSQAAMIVSPIIYTRCHTMMEFVLHFILAECIISIGNSDIIKRDKRKIIGHYFGIGLLCLYSFLNFCSIIGGYKRNDKINKLNHYKLVEIGKCYKEGYKIEEVELYKLYDDRYATNMPYQDGYEYIEYWMKNYYELPQGVCFYWREMRE